MQGAKRLATKFPYLKQLYFSSNNLTAACTADFSANTTLKVLNLSGNNITNAGIPSFADCQLEILSLSGSVCLLDMEQRFYLTIHR